MFQQNWIEGLYTTLYSLFVEDANIDPTYNYYVVQKDSQFRYQIVPLSDGNPEEVGTGHMTVWPP